MKTKSIESIIFKCMSDVNGLLQRGDDWDLLQEGVEFYLMATMSPVNTPTFFVFTPIFHASKRHTPKIHLPC
jgi:hypothetical protein